MNIADLAITSLETITAFNIQTGNYMFTLDELQDATIANTEEKQDITGKQGRKLTSLKRNKAATISGTNGLLSGGLLAVQAGASIEDKTTTVMWVDYLTVKTNKANTNYKAIGTVGAEIRSLHIRNEDGSLGEAYTQNTAAASKQFKYTPDSKQLEFESLADGTEIVVCYERKIQASTMENMSDKYSTKCTLYVDAMAEDRCGKVYRVQFYIPKADFSGEFSLEMGDNQTVHAFEAEALSGGCGGSPALWTYTVFGEGAPDAE